MQAQESLCQAEKDYLQELVDPSTIFSKNRSELCFIDTIPNPEDFLFVDIRSASDFALGHVSNSLNISPLAIKSKLFLKEKSLLIIDDGFQRSKQEELCAGLIDAGFKKVKILSNGIRNNNVQDGYMQRYKPIYTYFNAVQSKRLLSEMQQSDVQLASDNKRDFKELADVFDSVILLNKLEPTELIQELAILASSKGLANKKTIVLFSSDHTYQALLSYRKPMLHSSVYFFDGGVSDLIDTYKKSPVNKKKNKIPNRYKCKNA